MGRKRKLINILLVDDDSDKIGKIITSISKSNSISNEQLDFAEDITSAKKKIKQKYYDLLILDIALPNKVGEKIINHGGIELLSEISNRKNKYKIPFQIIGLTQHKNILSDVHKKLDKMSIVSIHYDRTSMDWLETLNFTIRKVIDQKTSFLNYATNYQSFLCIVCALDDPELKSMLDVGWTWKQIRVNGDHSIYYKSIIKQKNSSLNIFLTSAPRMGMPACAATAAKMIFNFRPKYIAMVGITAGYSDKTAIGDLIIADPAWDYGSGKWVHYGNQEEFLQHPHQISIDQDVHAKFVLLKNETEFFYDLNKEFDDKKPSTSPQLYIGASASGSAVIASEEKAKQIALQNRKLLGLEMETYALYTAAQESTSPRPKFFSIKSVVDFANNEKNDNYHRYASYISAQTLKYFVEKYLVGEE